jgi:NAD(P)-dependent dehydrogenase (short-subunit alcohol dehydrogenase family)
MSVIFLTGASSGIGRSLALRLALQGETIAAVARRKPLLDTLVEEIARAGGRALAVPCDVTDRTRVFAAVEETRAEFGPIDRLIANAGGGEPTFVETFDAAHVRRVFALNVEGTANCIEAVLPAMLRRGAGHIVAVSSLAAYRGLPGAAAYSAAKAALSNMVESLRIDLKPHGIAVTLICPGFVRTRSSAKKKGKPFQLEVEDAARRMARAIATRKPYYAFPLPLVFVAALGRMLPPTLYDRMLSGRGRRFKPVQ